MARSLKRKRTAAPPEEPPVITASVIRQQLEALPDLPAMARHTLRDQLMQELYSPDTATRAASAIGLGRIGDDRAVPLLISASADADPLVRWHAVHALRSLSENMLVAPGTIVVEHGAAYDIWQHNVLQQLAARLAAPDGADRADAVAALLETGAPAALTLLIPALLDEYEHVRQAAGAAIVQLVALHPAHGAAAAGWLQELLGNPDNNARAAAITVLALLGRAEIAPWLLPLLHDADATVRRSACDALALLGERRAVASLVSRLADDEPLVRRAAGFALAELGGTELQAVLLRVVNDESPIARQGIIRALAAVGDGAAFAVLMNSLHDTDDDVVRFAIGGLGRLGDKHALSALRRLRRSRVGLEARAALRQIEQGNAVS